MTRRMTLVRTPVALVPSSGSETGATPAVAGDSSVGADSVPGALGLVVARSCSTQ